MKTIIPILFFLLSFDHTRGQAILIKHKSRDRSYIKDFYRHHLILRVYECTKFNNVKLIDGHDKLIYQPNRHNDIGLGFNYKALSLNLEFFIPSTGKSNDVYGATHSFDIQTYIYVQQFIVDFYTQFYHGYFLSNGGERESPYQPAQVVVRPDIKTTDLSLNVVYVVNDKQFSFNAPFFQNEIQSKSAGSLLVGGGIYYIHGRADSSFVPTMLKDPDFFKNEHFNSFSYTSVGANIGYAYTQVIKKHFFITGALSGGPGIGYSFLRYPDPHQKSDRVGMAYNATARFGAGWSSDKFFVGATYLRLTTENNAVAPHTWGEDNTGKFMFTVAERFRLKRSPIPKSGIIKIE